MKKRLLSLVTVISIMLSLFPVFELPSFAADGTLTKGDDDYYLIEDAADLIAFASMVNSGNRSINGKLTADITLNNNVLNTDGTLNDGSFEQWTPIGSDSIRFNGIFDGDGHTISGLYYNNTSNNYVGLFVYNMGTIKNLGIVDSYIAGRSLIGAVCAQNYEGTIENCYNTGTVAGTGEKVGGISGYNDPNYKLSLIKGCYNTGKISGDRNVGGVCGTNWSYLSGKGHIINCYNIGAVSGNSNVGGVAGENSGRDTLISSCYNTGAVSGNHSVGAVCGGKYGGSISNCYYNIENAAGDSASGITGKTTDQFKSGEVAKLLQNGQSEIFWVQGLGDNADASPVLAAALTEEEKAAKTVYKVTFAAQDKATVVYANPDGVALPEGPAVADGYVLKWAVSENATAFTENTPVTEDITLNAYIIDNTAKELTVRFDKHTDNERIYDIVVVPTDNTKEIYRLSSVELKFALKAENDAAIGYEITPVKNVNMVEKDGAFEFNFDGEDAPDKSAPKIKIGEVEFTGYGSFYFACVSYADAKVNTAKLANNIVNTYIPGGDGKTVGKLTLNGANGEINTGSETAIIHPEFIPAAKKLTINIAYPNRIMNQKVAYQDMKVTISGGDLTAEKVIKLGKTSEATDENASENTKTNAKVTFSNETDCKYTIEVDNELTENIAYTVTVEGAGYRTARHTVTMTADKELNFWNNVKETAVAVEGEKPVMKSNFLAGDIVKDNNINLYDLSAVVSYFGTANDENVFSDYAKYDLNRDGLIDSKDIAYVLVSWNN